MNWTEEDIDQLFKDSANQLNVPFQDSYWTEMEAMLPQTKSKKGLGWIFGGTIACLALISTFFFPESAVKSTNISHGIAHTETKNITKSHSIDTGISTKTNLTENSTNTESQSKIAKQKNKSNFNRFAKTVNTFSSTQLDENGQSKNALNISQPTEIDVEISNLSPENDFATMQKLPLTFVPNQENFLATSNFKNANLKRKSNSLYVQLGAGLAESYMQTSSSNWMPTFSIGGGYQYTPQGFGFTAGLNLNTSFSNNLEINRKSKVYNFGSTNYEQNFRYKQIYTLELPLSVDFRRNRQTFSVGIAPTYIASSLMRYSQLEDGNISEDEVYIGQKVGLGQFGLKPSISYQLEIAKGWNVGIQLSTQIIQQVDNTQFIGTSRSNPLSGQITVRKSILKF